MSCMSKDKLLFIYTICLYRICRSKFIIESLTQQKKTFTTCPCCLLLHQPLSSCDIHQENGGHSPHSYFNVYSVMDVYTKQVDSGGYCCGMSDSKLTTITTTNLLLPDKRQSSPALYVRLYITPMDRLIHLLYKNMSMF